MQSTPDITLTPRQQRTLRYLARRHMHQPRIVKRKTFADLKPLNTTPTPDRAEASSHPYELTDSIVPLLDEPGEQTLVTIESDAPPPSPLPHKIPPMPPLPMRIEPILAVPPSIQRKEQLQLTTIATKHYKNPWSHTLTRRQKLLRRLSRKHLHQTRALKHLASLRLWSIISVLTAIALLLTTAGSAATYSLITQTRTTYGHQAVTLRSLLPADNLKIFDSKGTLLTQLTDQGMHTTITFEQISPTLINATVATEDKNFWTNNGTDLPRILRAALDDLQNGRVVEGGSTITQQLIKVLIVGDRPTLIRKLQEIILIPSVTSRYTKHDILEMYLNTIYYGHQAYGIDAAASVYFGLEDKPGQAAAMQLDLAQSAMLAGIPSNPSRYDPLLHPDAAFARFAIVLEAMELQGYITNVQALDAMHEAQDPHFFKSATTPLNRAPHFTNFVLSELQHMFHLNRSDLSRSGLIVYTTLDINLQDKLQKIAQQHIAELRAAHHLTNAAEVLIDFHTGAIISLLGSIDYNDTSIDGQFDVATSYRQPGSSFKPYIYVTAFQQGASPAQAIDDQPITIPLPGQNPATFSPQNYDLSYHGHMTLRCALQNSLNIPAVKVLLHTGIPSAMQTAYNMGITSYQGSPGYSLVLGGLGIRLLDHTSAMGVFANGGVRHDYYAINTVIAANRGIVLFQHQSDPGKRVLSPQLAYMMNSVLSDNASRTPEFFDCNVLQLYAHSQQACLQGNRGSIRPAAAKTGTTTDFRDNWTVGYTTDYVMGVWAGNDDASPMVDVNGLQGAAPIWHDSMLLAEQGHPIRDFTYPAGLRQATVTYPDGVQTTDLFLPGTIPASAPPPTPTPDPLSPHPVPSTAAPKHFPYCPSSYSFAFAPPSGGIFPNGWW